MPESKDQDKPDSGVKRRSTSTDSPDHKRQNRGPRAKKAAKKSESPIDELSEEEKPKPRKRKAPAPPKTKAKVKVVESESESSLTELEDEDEESPKPEKESASDDDEVSAINAVVDSKSGEEESGKDDEKNEEKKAGNEETPSAPVDEEEEYSDVIDEPVKPKRKKRETKDKKATTAKSTKASKAASKPTSKSDDPNEAEIKRLQSYLIKCGIRKLWHNELKKYGDDSRAKIKHLKKMLADVGMDGRFSEAKAREIKDRRELLAELESAQEMNELWGRDTNGRASRSKNKNVKEDGGQSAGEEDDEEEEEEEQQAFAARRRRAQADFAFLGDDSDSD